MIASENSLFDYGSWLSAFLFLLTLLFVSVWFHANARKLCKRFPIADKEATDASTIIESEARTKVILRASFASNMIWVTFGMQRRPNTTE